MNRNQLAQELAVSERMPLSSAFKAIDGLVRIVTEQLVKGETVKIRGFGGLHPVECPEYERKHPQTGDPVTVKARRSVRFRIGETFNARLNPEPEEDIESWEI